MVSYFCLRGRFLLQNDCQRLSWINHKLLTIPPNRSHILCLFFRVSRISNNVTKILIMLIVRHHKGRRRVSVHPNIWNLHPVSVLSFIPSGRTFCSKFFLLLPHTPHLLLVPPPTTTTILLCLRLIKISKIQMAAGWLLSGNLPLIITGGDAWGKVGGAETNGKLDFFTELEWGGGIHILTSHQQAVDQEKCFGLVGDGGGKLAMMLCGILIRYLQPPPGCRQDQTHLHLLD